MMKGFQLKQTSDFGYIVCGKTNSFGNNYSDIFIIKPIIMGIQFGQNLLSVMLVKEDRSLKKLMMRDIFLQVTLTPTVMVYLLIFI